MPGVEDALVGARHVFDRVPLGRLMIRASLFENFWNGDSDLGLKGWPFSFDETGLRRVGEEVGAAFACGESVPIEVAWFA